MQIGIIGSGNMGAALGKAWLRRGHQVLFSYSRHPEKLARLAAYRPGGLTGSVAEAVRYGDVLMLAVPYASLPAILPAKDAFAGKVVITCVSGIRPDFTGQTMGLPSPLQVSVAEEIARALPGAHVVEAFNLAFSSVMDELPLVFKGEKPSIFYCGENPEAKQITAQLIEHAGYEPVDAGGLKTARAQETLASAWVQFAVASGLFPRVGLKAVRG